jgi:hypothetical protein
MSTQKPGGGSETPQEPILNGEVVSDAETGEGLEPYRNQARELEEALAKVKAIQDQAAAVALQRDNVSKQRQGLLDSWENESAVAELSKLGSRVEMAEVKLASLANKLAEAEAELKTVLETFGTSFRNLHSSLVTYLYRAAMERILSSVHPDVRVRAKSTCSDVAWLTTEVIDAGPFRIPTLSDFMTIPSPEFVLRHAEQSLARSDALLSEASKRVESGFVPPEVFTMERWRASVSPGVPIAA